MKVYSNVAELDRDLIDCMKTRGALVADLSQLQHITVIPEMDRERFFAPFDHQCADLDSANRNIDLLHSIQIGNDPKDNSNALISIELKNGNKIKWKFDFSKLRRVINELLFGSSKIFSCDDHTVVQARKCWFDLFSNAGNWLLHLAGTNKYMLNSMQAEKLIDSAPPPELLERIDAVIRCLPSAHSFKESLRKLMKA